MDALRVICVLLVGAALLSAIIVSVIAYFIKRNNYPTASPILKNFYARFNRPRLKIYELRQDEFAFRWIDKSRGLALIAVNTSKHSLKHGSEIWGRYSSKKIIRFLVCNKKEVITSPSINLEVSLVTLKSIGVAYENQ